MKKEKVVLVILDGFGIGENDSKTNAIYAANTPFFDEINQKYPVGAIYASEEAVGIEKGQFGNSELGHMTMGSGRTILGINERFNNLIDKNELDAYLKQFSWVQELLNNDKVVHLCGMYSTGCVHSNLKHIDALVDFFQRHNKKIALYLISDGRDTPPQVFLNDFKLFETKLLPSTKVIAISGRYYGMDRDKNVDRTQQFYQAMHQDKQYQISESFDDYIQQQYNQGIDDEFIKCACVSEPDYQIKKGDTILFLNYRADRIRQIIEAHYNQEVELIGLAEYAHVNLDHIIMDKQPMQNVLGEIISKNGYKQIRIAETEKFAHVTFFFNGGKSTKFDNEEQILIPSPKVATYDLQPEMSCEGITKAVIENLDKYDLFIINYANADMVGHTGNFEATKKAIEFLDKQCKQIYDALAKYDGTMIITADHGNADYMMDSDNNVVKTHSIAKVPFHVLSNKYEVNLFEGSLQDIAPSILFLYGIDKPSEMDGHNLIKEK